MIEGMALEYISKNLYFTDSTGYIGVIRLQSPGFSDFRCYYQRPGKSKGYYYSSSCWVNRLLKFILLKTAVC